MKVHLGRRQRPYPPEFREEALYLTWEGGKSIEQVAEDLELAEQSLRNWIKQGDLDASHRADGLTTEERAELHRLRRGNPVLRDEQEVLKRTAAFFARESHSEPGGLQVRKARKGRSSRD